MGFAIFILGLVLFLGIHSVRIFAPDIREQRIRAGGQGQWRGIYSLVSAIGLVLIIVGYWQAQPLAPVIYVPTFALVHVNVLLMLFAFIALAVYATPSGRLKPMLKHPMLLAVKIWAVGHLLSNGDLASIILFGSFLAWAVTDRISVKRRGVANPVAGPIRNDVIAVVAGAVVWWLFIWKLHEWLIGVPVPIA